MGEADFAAAGGLDGACVDASAGAGNWLSQRGLGVASFDGEQSGSGAALEEGHSPVGQQRFVDFGQGRSDEGQWQQFPTRYVLHRRR